MLELEETITGQLSEQKTNQVALEKELLETQNELRAEGLSGIERELEELEDDEDEQFPSFANWNVESYKDNESAILMVMDYCLYLRGEYAETDNNKGCKKKKKNNP